VSSSVTVLNLCTGNTLDVPALVCSQDEWNSLRQERVPRLVMDVGFVSSMDANTAVAQLEQYLASVSLDSVACKSCLEDLVRALPTGSTHDACTRNTYGCVSLTAAFDAFETCSGFVFDYVRPCTEEEIDEIDGRFGIYHTVLTGGAGTAFKDAYTRLSCRVCFDNLVNTVTTERPSWSADCDSDVYSGQCTSDTATVITEFGKCSGQPSRVSTARRYAGDGEVLFNQVLRMYTALRVCSKASHPVTSAVAWNKCMLGYSPVMDLTGVSWSSCVQALALGLFAWEGTSCGTTPNTIECNTSLSGLVQTFYACSGIKLIETPSSVCTAADIRSNPIWASYPMIIELAMGVTGAAAAKAVFSLIDTTLPCSSCYGKLAAELALGMSADDKRQCNDVYSAGCRQNRVVTDALDRFSSCAGVQLTNVSGYTCTSDEWEVLRASEVSQAVVEGITSGTTTLMHLTLGLWSNMKTLRESSMSFRCEKCFHDLIVEMLAMGKEVRELCAVDINSSACLYGGAHLPLQRFVACSGQELVLSVTTTSTETPPMVDFEATTTSTPGTTKNTLCLLTISPAILATTIFLLQ
jgi:hypothetical protein